MGKNIIIPIIAILLVMTLSIVSPSEECTYQQSATPEKVFNCNSPNGCIVWIRDLQCNQFVSGQYNCKSFYYLTISGSQETRFIEYIGNNTGYYGLNESKAISLNQGDKIELNFEGIIEYKNRICSVCECSTDVCQGSLIRKCININPSTGCGMLSSAVSCQTTGEVCIPDFGECYLPYEFHIDLGKKIGISQDTFLPTEEVSVRSRVDSYLVKGETLVTSIYRGNEFISKKERPIVLPMPIGNYIYEDFSPMSMGNYRAEVRIKGTNYFTERTFAISDTLCVRANFLDRTRFVTNKEISLVLETMDSTCTNFVTIPNYQTSIEVNSTLNGNTLEFTTNEVSDGVYSYSFIMDKTGLFKVDFVIKRDLYPEVTIGKTQTIGQPYLQILPKFKEFSSVGTHKLDFKVIDEQGEFISPDSISVELEPSLGSKIIIAGDKIIKEVDGYYLNHYFDIGTYKMSIFVSKEGYSSDTSVTLIDITGDSDVIDSDGFTMDKNLIIYSTLGVLVVAIGIVLFIGRKNIWRKRR